MIRNAAMIICNIFKHSPVFRIGGDEFAVILRGADFEARTELMAKLEARNQENLKSDGIVIAGGLAVYDPERDQSTADVFHRADTKMYRNKTDLKH